MGVCVVIGFYVSRDKLLEFVNPLDINEESVPFKKSEIQEYIKETFNCEVVIESRYNVGTKEIDFIICYYQKGVASFTKLSDVPRPSVSEEFKALQQAISPNSEITDYIIEDKYTRFD